MVGYKSQDYLSWFQTLENIKTVLNIIQGWCAQYTSPTGKKKKHYYYVFSLWDATLTFVL